MVFSTNDMCIYRCSFFYDYPSQGWPWTGTFILYSCFHRFNNFENAMLQFFCIFWHVAHNFAHFPMISQVGLFFWKRLYEMLLVNCFIQNFYSITFLQQLVFWYQWNVYNAKSLFWIKTPLKTSKGSFRHAFLDI